ncbi:MAG: M1 family metallopeptidase [Pseudomonadota bacterium]|nr:M1 family metallopeptidase [Pseudomonadota bacterium]
MLNRLPIRIVLLLSALTSVAPLIAPATALGAAADAGRIMLPADVLPEHYVIDIIPDAAALTFQGSARIDVTVRQATRTIVLNSADLVIGRATVSGAAVEGIGYDEQRQTATIRLDKLLQPGSHILTLDYRGKIYQQASGLFALDYDTPQGKARALFTQFENSDARRFVPSWDEPGRKATFQLNATVPADQMAISNMPVESTEPVADHKKRVHFAATPRMSSYLLFFGSGDFERVQRTIGGVDVGVIVKRGDTASTGFALEAAAKILPYYNDYFGMPYPLPKLDLIAAPGSSQFFGAMENWGAIFYFEHDLLVDPRISTEQDRQQVYTTVAHEMAHQWFGDLVTMAWWDDLWLNEGFASWMANRVTAHFHPEWKIELQAQRETQFAMNEDAREGTHPIITPIHDVMQASSAFDAITYLKGAAVIRMLESYSGEDEFRAGVRRYMHEHAYGNTVTDDLWRSLDQHTRRPITSIAHDFTLQAGVPSIRELSSRCVTGTAQLQVAQKVFAIDADSTSSREWHVPVIVAPADGPTVTALVHGGQPQNLRPGSCGAVLLNAGQTAYFRSIYTAEGLSALTARFATLTPLDQLGVFEDTSALADAGEVPMAAFLDLARSFGPATDPIVAQALVGSLRHLDKLYDGLPTQPAFRAFSQQVIDPLFATVGWDKKAGEADNVALLRASLVAALSAFGDAPVIQEARRRFTRYLAEPSSLDAATRRMVLGVVARHADQPSWERLHGLAKSAKTELEREELYELLAAADDAALVKQALDLTSTGEMQPTTVPSMINAAAAVHPELAFDFAVAHWPTLVRLLEPTTQARFVPGLVRNASDSSLIARLDEFAAAHIPATARQDVKKADSNIRYLASIKKNRLPEIDRWIQSRAATTSR